MKMITLTAPKFGASGAVRFTKESVIDIPSDLLSRVREVVARFGGGIDSDDQLTRFTKEAFLVLNTNRVVLMVYRHDFQARLRISAELILSRDPFRATEDHIPSCEWHLIATVYR